jgi:DNA-directed RNA polymerase subunit K/omega
MSDIEADDDIVSEVAAESEVEVDADESEVEVDADESEIDVDEIDADESEDDGSDDEESVDEKEELLKLNAAISTDYNEIYDVVTGDACITSARLSAYEYTRLIATRAAQIEKGSGTFIPDDGKTSITQLAIMELKEKKCPLMLERTIQPAYTSKDGVRHLRIVEQWDPNIMSLPFNIADPIF